jgi:lipoprotein-anchoring transpeptidase ErfK/SrfK
VDYFIQFSYNVGIHDASWRSTFGGEIYKTSGSHGCINVPLKKAKKIFDNIEAGTPVVAYYRDDVTLTAYNNRIDNAYSYQSE